MVVLTPLLKEERVQTCRRCGAVGLVSPFPERSTFKPREQKLFRRECRRCTADYAAQQRRKRGGDRQLQLDGRRFREADYNERHGKPLPSFEDVKIDHPKIERWAWLPIEPLRIFLNKEVALRGAKQLADDLQTEDRRIYAWRFVQARINYATADRVCSRLGRLTVEDIYRTYGAMSFVMLSNGKFGFVVCHWSPEAAKRRESCSSDSVCRSPKCTDPVADGKRFCEEHAKTFARLKKELRDEGPRVLNRGGPRRRRRNDDEPDDYEGFE